jgi:hypothetical protein
LNKPIVDYKGILQDPIKFKRLFWPDMKLYDRQVEILRSLVLHDETYVPAGNQLGKDFITGLAVLWFFCSRSPCRVVTSSAGQRQLSAVLWGEIRRFYYTAKYPLPIDAKSLIIHQLKNEKGDFEPRSYVQGVVTNVPENMLGHHLERGEDNLPRTLAVFDEASSIADEYYEATDTWAHRKLIIGNPLPCSNFFFRGSTGGDILRDDDDPSKGKHINVIKIKASDSPNVRLAEAEIAAGKQPSHTNIIPGVVSYNDYLKRRKLWDPIRQCIGLDAEFYKGTEVLLFPPEWLNASEEQDRKLRRKARIKKKYERKAIAIGCDPAEGGDDTCWTVGDGLGILDKITIKTEDTSVITNKTIALIKQWEVKPQNVVFDAGGGGKQIADELGSRGYKVRTVGFGQSAMNENDQRVVYKNMRAQMYGELSSALEPYSEDNSRQQFAIPEKYDELRRQLAPIPRLYDAEGKLYLPPKSRPTPTYKGETLRSILGCSPDEADSLVLMYHGVLYQKHKLKLGVF